MDFCAVKKRYAGFGHLGSRTEGPCLDGVSGVLRLLADVALETLVSYWMFPENKERHGRCWTVGRNLDVDWNTLAFQRVAGRSAKLVNKLFQIDS